MDLAALTLDAWRAASPAENALALPDDTESVFLWGDVFGHGHGDPSRWLNTFGVRVCPLSA